MTGIRSTQGRIPFYNDTSISERPITVQLASVQGPLALNVADTKLAYEVMRGYSSLDPWSLACFTIGRPEIKKNSIGIGASFKKCMPELIDSVTEELGSPLNLSSTLQVPESLNGLKSSLSFNS